MPDHNYFVLAIEDHHAHRPHRPAHLISATTNHKARPPAAQRKILHNKAPQNYLFPLFADEFSPPHSGGPGSCCSPLGGYACIYIGAWNLGLMWSGARGIVYYYDTLFMK